MRGGNCLRFGAKGLEKLLGRDTSPKRKKLEQIPRFPSYIDGNRIMRYKRESQGMKFILFLENGEERRISIIEWMKQVKPPRFV